VFWVLSLDLRKLEVVLLADKWVENVLNGAINEYSFHWIKLWFIWNIILTWEIQWGVYMKYVLIEGKEL
jgi:hypothetical protein